MIFLQEEGQCIIVRCEKCGTDYMKQRVYFKQYGDEYHFNPPIVCSCGNIGKIAFKVNPDSDNTQQPDYDTIKCPQCGSTQIHALNKGFGLGKAVTGGALLGPVGLLGGFVGSQKTMITCLHCGKRWEAGK